MASLGLALLSTACGSDDESGVTNLCGNGNLDRGESCDDGNREGGDNCPANCRGLTASFDVGTNSCPAVTQVSVLPSEAALGTRIALSAVAVDSDGDRVYYDWTGSGGLLGSDANSNRTTFECSVVGSHVITLWVFDSHGCVATQTVSVTCR